jgi:hypothetical protein
MPQLWQPHSSLLQVCSNSSSLASHLPFSSSRTCPMTSVPVGLSMLLFSRSPAVKQRFKSAQELTRMPALLVGSEAMVAVTISLFECKTPWMMDTRLPTRACFAGCESHLPSSLTLTACCSTSLKLRSPTCSVQWMSAIRTTTLITFVSGTALHWNTAACALILPSTSRSRAISTCHRRSLKPTPRSRKRGAFC